MAKLEVSVKVLTDNGFSKPESANSFFPPNDDKYHIHLGVPSQLDGKPASDGKRFVSFVSIKNPAVEGGQNLRQIQVGNNAGKYDLDTGKVDWGKREDEFKNALRKTGIGVDTRG